MTKHLLLLILLLAFTTHVYPQASGPVDISGIITDENGDALIGASVSVNDTDGLATVTDIDGKFALSEVPENSVITVSYISYIPQEFKLIPGRKEYHITLKAVGAQLDEVVVVGYATQRKVDLTGAVSSIGAATLADRPLTNATNALAGLAPGLSVTNSGGNTPGYESQSILVRGQGTLNNSAPLVVVDGMTGIAISDINPQDIENISILKDAASSAIYGSRAANGVILITTRHGLQSAPRLTYSGNVSFETVAKRMNLVTA